MVWKSSFRQNYRTTFSPTVRPSAARISRFVTTWRYLLAKVGTSKRGGKQWQTTPKNLPRMQRTRAIPVASLTSGLCPDRPKGWIPIIIIIIIIIIKIAIRRPSLLWDVTQCRWTAYWSFLHLTLADGAERLSCIISNKLPVCAKQHRTRAKA